MSHSVMYPIADTEQAQVHHEHASKSARVNHFRSALHRDVRADVRRRGSARRTDALGSGDCFWLHAAGTLLAATETFPLSPLFCLTMPSSFDPGDADRCTYPVLPCRYQPSPVTKRLGRPKTHDSF
jgi:hypothetical protein